MVTYYKYSFLVALIFIVGCTNTEINDYQDDEVAAIVRGEEITIKELRFLYPDEKALDMLEGTIKARLVVQESKQMDIDVTEEIDQEINTRKTLPPKNTDDSSLKSIREFAEAQAKKLGMNPEEYYKKYVTITAEQNAYMQAYIQKTLGVPGDDEHEIEEYNDKANNLLNELVKENENEIEIRIK
jgi:hypothetical protein